MITICVLTELTLPAVFVIEQNTNYCGLFAPECNCRQQPVPRAGTLAPNR